MKNPTHTGLLVLGAALLLLSACSADDDKECLFNTDCAAGLFCADGSCQPIDAPDAGDDPNPTPEPTPEPTMAMQPDCEPELEICDGLNNDCDFETDEDNDDLLSACATLPNATADGCEQGRCTFSCEDDFSDDNGDLGQDNSDGCERACADTETTCDGIDDDCDGVVDEGCDDDGDGFCDADLEEGDTPPAACPNGFGDCDDTIRDINPGEDEACDDADNNCKDGVDEGCDDDEDGFCDADLVEGDALPAACPNGFGDCDDTIRDINPGVGEACDDVDNDCVDGVDNGCDDDNDGFCDIEYPNNGTLPAICPNGFDDCDDNAPTAFPGADEICDDIDNNCAGGTDEGCDNDEDGFCDADLGNNGIQGTTCFNGFGDCDDRTNAINPGADEICDDIDNNCADGVDEGCDDDGDGHCDVNVANNGVLGLTCTEGFEDCDDTLPERFPGNTEVCDGVDNNCDDDVDDDDPLYNDLCANQSGVCQGALRECLEGQPVECEDDRFAEHSPDFRRDPLFGELLCDGLDNNCDGAVDEICDPGLCDGGVERDTPNLDSLHPAVAAGPDGLFAMAWIERNDSLDTLTIASFDAATNTVSVPPSRIDSGPRDTLKWPVAVYEPVERTFRFFYVHAPTDGNDQLRTLNVPIEGAPSGPTVAFAQETATKDFGPLDATVHAQGFAVSTTLFNTVIGSVSPVLLTGPGDTMSSGNTSPIPPGGTSTSIEDGQANVAIASNPVEGLFFAVEDRDSQSRAVFTVGSTSNSLSTRDPNDAPGVAWPAMGQHSPPDEVVTALFTYALSPDAISITRIRYRNPADLTQSRNIARVVLPTNALPNNLHHLTTPDSNQWLAVWRQGGSVTAIGDSGDRGLIQDPPITLADDTGPLDTHAIDVDSRLRSGNLVVIGREDAPSGLDLIWVNALGDRICPAAALP